MSIEILHLDYQTKKYARISPTGSVIASEPKRLVGGGFVGSLDTTQWTANNSGAGSAVTVTTVADLNPGTTSGGYAAIQTINKGRFLFASANNFRSNFRVTQTGVANCTMQWGAMNFGTLPAIQDGFFFSYDGTNLGVNTCINGVTTNVVSGNFNGELPPTFNVDTNQHVFEIIYQVPTALFIVDGKLLHTFKTTTGLLSSTQHFTAAAISTNTAASAGATLEVWAMSIVRFGSTDSANQVGVISALGTTTLKIGPGVLQNVFIGTGSSGGNTITIYDSVTGSGKVIATISAGASSGRIGYDFINGLTVVSSGGSSGSITLVYE